MKKLISYLPLIGIIWASREQMKSKLYALYFWVAPIILTIGFILTLWYLKLK
jgi:hypothetical protein